MSAEDTTLLHRKRKVERFVTDTVTTLNAQFRLLIVVSLFLPLSLVPISFFLVISRCLFISFFFQLLLSCGSYTPFLTLFLTHLFLFTLLLLYISFPRVFLLPFCSADRSYSSRLYFSLFPSFCVSLLPVHFIVYGSKVLLEKLTKINTPPAILWNWKVHFVSYRNRHWSL